MSDENHHLPLSQKLSQSQTTRRGDSFLLEILSALILVCFLVSTCFKIEKFMKSFEVCYKLAQESIQQLEFQIEIS